MSTYSRAFQMRIELFSREAAQDRSPGWSEAKAWVRSAQRQPRNVAIWHNRSGQGVQENNLSLPTVDRSVLCRKKYSDLGKPTKRSAAAKKHPQPPRNCTVSGTFQPENSRNEGNTYYNLNRQTTHSYTTYGNTRGAEKRKIAETL